MGPRCGRSAGRDPPGARARLDTAFEAHLAMEDAMLAPIVRRMAWGRARCERMELEHQQQRHRLDAFEVAIADASLFPELAAIEASALVAELREHMDFEERDLLSSELLRDDAVVIEQTNR